MRRPTPPDRRLPNRSPLAQGRARRPGREKRRHGDGDHRFVARLAHVAIKLADPDPSVIARYG